MRIPLFVFLLVASLVSARADGTERSIDVLVEKIRAELPRGWGVLYEKKSSEIEVIRLHSREDWFSPAKPVADGGPQPIVTVFVFRVVPKVSPAEYSRLKAKNVPIKREMAQIWTRIGKLGKESAASFEPKTPGEMADVVRYAELEKSLQPLPEYYFQDIGLQQMPAAEIETRGLDLNEVATMERKILKLLSHFEPQK